MSRQFRRNIIVYNIFVFVKYEKNEKANYFLWVQQKTAYKKLCYFCNKKKTANKIEKMNQRIKCINQFLSFTCFVSIQPQTRFLLFVVGPSYCRNSHLNGLIRFWAWENTMNENGEKLWIDLRLDFARKCN